MPSPATVMMSPVAFTTSRTTLLIASLKNTSPAGSTHHAVGTVELGVGGLPAIAGVALGAVAGDRHDRAGRLHHLADLLVVGVGDEQVAGPVDGHAVGAVELGGGGRAAVAGVARAPLPATVLMVPVVLAAKVALPE